MNINVHSMARKVKVDNRIPLRNYYRIADNLLRQANIYREEKNVIDLHIILIRYSSLVSETLPCHQDYQRLNPKERSAYEKRLIAVLDELESLKLNFNIELSANMAMNSSWNYGRNQAHSYPLQMGIQFQKLNLNLPLAKQDTLSRHSFLGPNGLQGQWLGPSSHMKVQYPSNTELTSTENYSLTPDGQHDALTVRDGVPGGAGSAMESVLSLDDGRWSRPANNSSSLLINEAREDPFQFFNIKQPSPPSVLAQVRDLTAIPLSRVADPRPGPVTPFSDGCQAPILINIYMLHTLRRPVSCRRLIYTQIIHIR